MNPDDFLDRYAVCPLCKRDNVRLRHYAGSVVLDEHPMDTAVVARPAPVDPDATFNPRAAETTSARVRCPASLAPLVPLEGW